MKKKLFYLLLVLVVVNLFLYLYAYRFFFTRKFDSSLIGHLYSNSQYVVGELSQGGIGDDGLYAFAGYYYVFEGGDVSSVNFEHPPLGKYLIGLSIYFFKNQNVVNIFYFILLLLFTYKISETIEKNKLLSLSSVAIVSIDCLFLDNLWHSLLDLPFTLFVVMAIYFFLQGLENKKKLIVSSIFWGVAFSTRFFPFLIVLWLYMLLVVVIARKKAVKTFIISSFIIPFIYFLSHLSFFYYHPSVIEFLRHKKWMLAWFTGSPVIFGNIWQNILTGKYLDSTRILRQNTNWTLFLPVIAILGVTRFRLSFFKKKNLHRLVMYGFCFIFLAYLTVLTNGLHKYLMPILPLLVILAVSHFYLLCTNSIGLFYSGLKLDKAKKRIR